MPQTAYADATTFDSGCSEIVARYREAWQKERDQPADGLSLGETIIIDPLQYSMFDNVAEAFHFHADLNPDLTHFKQPVIHAWTEGEKRRLVRARERGAASAA